MSFFFATFDIRNKDICRIGRLGNSSVNKIPRQAFDTNGGPHLFGECIDTVDYKGVEALKSCFLGVSSLSLQYDITIERVLNYKYPFFAYL